jgi:hypothetical protein
MIIELTAQLETALKEQAQRRGVTPEELALEVLRQRFAPRPLPFEPQDEWERKLLSIALDAGYSPPDWALSSEGLYE